MISKVKPREETRGQSLSFWRENSLPLSVCCFWQTLVPRAEDILLFLCSTKYGRHGQPAKYLGFINIEPDDMLIIVRSLLRRLLKLTIYSDKSLCLMNRFGFIGGQESWGELSRRSQSVRVCGIWGKQMTKRRRCGLCGEEEAGDLDSSSSSSCTQTLAKRKTCLFSPPPLYFCTLRQMIFLALPARRVNRLLLGLCRLALSTRLFSQRCANERSEYEMANIVIPV